MIEKNKQQPKRQQFVLKKEMKETILEDDVTAQDSYTFAQGQSQIKRKRIQDGEKDKPNEMQRENGVKRCPSKKTRSLSKDKFKVERESKNFQIKICSIQNKIDELKFLLQKRKDKEKERKCLRQKIKKNRKLQENQNEKKHYSLGKNSKNSQSFLSTILTKDKLTKVEGVVTQMSKTEKTNYKSTFSINENNTYYISQVIKAYKDPNSAAREHIQNTLYFFQALQGIKMPSTQSICSKKLKLPRFPGYEDKKTIVFDLDETLIHCNNGDDDNYDVILPINISKNQKINAKIKVRPGAVSLLRELSKSFEIIVFTASLSCYGNAVIDYLDQTGEYVHHRLFRQHCHFVPPDGPYIKDLRILDRDLSKVVLIDNAAYSYLFQKQNGIPIIPYYFGQDDLELFSLQRYLEGLAHVEDVREKNMETFKLHEYKKCQNPCELVQWLYLN